MQVSVSSRPELAALLRAELARDETVLWEAQSLAAHWTARDWVRHDPVYKRWYLLVPGLSKFSGKMLTSAARNLLYVVTNRRVILVYGTMSVGDNSRPSWVASITAEELLERNVIVRADGSGDLLFPHAQTSYPLADNPRSPQDVMGFHKISDVRAVDELISGVCERSRTSGPNT